MTPSRFRLVSANLLAEFRERGDKPEYWANQWRDIEYDQFLRRYERGYLGEYGTIFRKYLPRLSRIIEAGCGRGQYVAALWHLGYDIVGVDFARDLIDGIRRARPAMPVELGDVRRLDVPNGSFGAYVSLGVMEHFRDGMDTILAEAHRVLASGGMLLASVPHFNPAFRRWARKHGLERGGEADPADAAFYQFYFTKEEFRRRLQVAGFDPVDTFYYDAKYGAIYNAWRAFPFLERLYKSSYIFRAGVDLLFRFGVPQKLQARFSHMVMIIARKT